MTRKSIRRKRFGQIETLEARQVLAAPVAVDDTFNILEDSQLAGSGGDITANFDQAAATVPIFGRGSTWSFLDGITNGVNGTPILSYPTDADDNAWFEPNFDISTSTVGPWGSGAGPLGAGGGMNAAATVTPMLGVTGGNQNNTVTTYLFRRTFDMSPGALATALAEADVICDDGCKIYINGNEAFSLNMAPGVVNTQQEALNSNGTEDAFSGITFSQAGLNLQPQGNVIAVELHQSGAASSDAGFEMGLSATDGVQGFVYNDNVLGTDAARSGWAGGDQPLQGGFNGTGALHTRIVCTGFCGFGGGSSSGGWSRTISLASAASVTVSTRYRLIQGQDADNNEFAQAVLMVDGTRYGVPAAAGRPTPVLAEFTGNGNGGTPNDSNWQTASFTIPLTAGDHTLTLASFINASGGGNEYMDAFFDDVVISGIGGAEGASIVANDSDPESNPFTAAIVTPPAHGTIEDFDPVAGTVFYRPTANYNGQDSFTYQLDDGTATSNVATVRINISPVNDPPTAVNDPYTMIANAVLSPTASAGLLSNDIDVDSASLTAGQFTAVARGTLVARPDGSFTYTPEPDFTGQVTFNYTANDGQFTSTAATVTINVIPGNNPPTAHDDSYSVVAGTTLTITDPLAPAATIAYRNDFNGGAPTVAPGVNASLTGVTSTEGVQNFNNLGSPGNRFGGNFLRNGTNNDGAGPAGLTTITLANLPAHNRIDINFLLGLIDSWDGNTGNGSPDLFNVMLDGQSIFSEAFQTSNSFDGTYVPADGVLLADGLQLGFGQGGFGGGGNVDAAYDMGEEPVFNDIEHSASSLTLSFFASGQGWTGTDNSSESWAIDNLSIVFNTVFEQEFELIPTGAVWNYLDNGSDQGTNWRGTGFNDASWSQGPAELGYGDAAEGRPEATPVSFGGNPTDKHVTTYFRRTFNVDNLAEIASLELQLLRDDGAAVYLNGVEMLRDNLAPAAAFDRLATSTLSGSGETSLFTKSISPAFLIPGTNTIAVEIHQASHDSDDLSFDLRLVAARANAFGVASNDTDPDRNPLSAQVVVQPEHGNLTLNTNGTFDYQPAAGYRGPDSFTYVASDGQLTSNPATVSITVLPGPDQAPIGLHDDYTIAEDGTLTVPALGSGVLHNDIDVDGDTLTALLATSPAHGTLTFNSDGSFTYQPHADYFGEDFFTYVAFDGVLPSGPVPVEIDVTPTPDTPVALDDVYFVPRNGALNVPAATGVAANDRDGDNDPLTVTILSPPAQGQFVPGSNGSFTYQPVAGSTASVSFTYRVQDPSLRQSNVATATIHVNSPPAVAADFYNVNEDGVLNVPTGLGVLANDSDADQEPFNAELVSDVSHGVLSLSAGGAIIYTPAADYSGPDSFTYRADDGQQESIIVTVSINVVAQNDPPTAEADAYTAFENAAFSVPANRGVLANDGDIDGPSLVAELVGDVSHGTLDLEADGSFTYTPTNGFSGQDGFTYRASDGLIATQPIVVTLVVAPASQLITINEIMYHPADVNGREPTELEYVELRNLSTSPIDLTGWQLTRGVAFTFPSASIPGSGYLVIAANTAAFSAKYPSVTNVVGGWTGTLANSGEDVEIEDPLGARVDLVAYADEGDWGTRILGPNDQGTRGWEWEATHDGLGRSLELVNAAVKNNQGQNWRGSAVVDGTPGAANSVAATDTAPLIENITHSPAVPKTTDSVTITAELTDDVSTGLSSTVYYRIATNTPGPFQTAAMFDDGAHGDGASGDGLFGVILPPQTTDRTVVEFYVTASDNTGHSRTVPTFTSDQNNRTANLLYQVDNEVYTGNQPVYRFISTPIEQNIFNGIQRDSNAQMNATFVATLGSEADVRYNAGYRVRGESSRQRPQFSMKLNIPSDRPWTNITSVNINSQYTWLQVLGGTLSQLAGLVAYDSRPIQLRMSGVNTAVNNDIQFGSYAHVEPFGSEFIDAHLPDDAAGNMYKKVRPDNKWPVFARLGDGSVNIAEYVEDGWSKDTNAAANDWTDLDNFLRVMNTATGPTYLQQVDAVADLDQWATFFAITALMNHRETNASNGVDDDYDIYHAAHGMQFLPHDYDTIFGLGDTNSQPNATIFQAAEGFAGQGVIQPLVTLFRNPTFLQKYYAELRRMLDTVYSAAQFDPMVDNLLTGWVPQASIDQIKSFAAQRRAFVETQLPRNLTATTNATPQSGIPRTTNPSAVTVGGSLNPLTTSKVLVAGQPANVDLYARTYTTSAGTGGTTNTLLPAGAVWKYLDNGSDQGTAWRTEAFDDAAWASGPAQLGYGDGDEATAVACGTGDCGAGNTSSPKHVTTHFRTTFNVTNAAQYAGLRVRLQRDDGAVMYLNGQEVLRDNMPAAPTPILFDTVTTNAQDDGAALNTLPDLASTFGLKDGLNTIAVEIHQSGQQGQPITSSDISFNLELLGIIPSATTGIPLSPGVNRVLVQALDSQDREVERRTIDIWYDDSNETTVPAGTISTNTTWLAANGPYHVTGNVTIAEGATLTIEPGTTVLFDGGFGLLVNGQLLAEGTELRHIRMRPPIGSTTPWAGIRFVDTNVATVENNRLAWVDMENGDSRGDSIESRFATLSLDHMTWVSTSAQILDMDDSSFVVKNSTFPGIGGGSDGELIHGNRIRTGGQAIIEGNTFGVTNGYNDVIDFTGGQRPGPIIQILNNVFSGGSDDALDFDGTDAHIEGNIFKNFHKNNTSDSSSNAIATGVDGGSASELTIVRNSFYNNDHAVLVKEGSSIVFQHNTVVNSTIAAINFDEPNRPVAPGLGALVEGSIFDQTVPTFENVYDNHPTEGTTQLTVNHSLVGAAYLNRGLANLDAALGARIASPQTDDYSLAIGSPAKGAGPNGIDMGGDIPAGASLGGVPSGTTATTDILVTVGGPGLSHYEFRMDGGPFSAPTALTTPITLGSLGNGPHTLEVRGVNSAGVMQSPPTTAAWTVDTAHSQIRINEVLALNNSAISHGGTYPDLIELYNSGGNSVNLGGWSLTDELDTPAKFVFPANTVLDPGEYLTLYADDERAAGELHLGFGLQGDGDDLTFFNNAPTRQIVDQLIYGVQLPNLSIGVLADGEWGLAQPTFGAGNLAQRTGDPTKLRINEWLVGQQRLYREDRLELFNPDPLPVDAGGMYLTDNPSGDPLKHRITPLTFIAGSGYGVFIPDEASTLGANHLNYRLASEFEIVALLGSDGKLVDQVAYMSQRDDISQGRTSDGAATYTTFFPPNIGLPNSTGQQGTVTLVADNAAWKYDATATDLGTAWRETGYNDTAWASGPAGLGFSVSLPGGVVNTVLPTGANTYYFRTHFNVSDPAGTQLSLRHRFDDGAVIFVNGQEVFRVGMPAGPVSYTTVPTRSVGDATAFDGPVTLPSSVLVAGDNVIAVELHNILPNDSDALMSLELTATVSPTVIQLLDSLRITEVMYNPVGPNDETEYVELQNVGSSILDLTGVTLSNAIDFTFPAMMLAPNEYVVVVRDPIAFEDQYGTGINVAGVFTGRLDNTGEKIDLELPAPFEHNIQDFTYDDGWYPATDGLGPSIVIRDPRSTDPQTWDDPAGWRQSGAPAGSPGEDDPIDATPPAIGQVLLGSTQWTEAFLSGLSVLDLGNGGYVIEQTPVQRTAPWTNVNQITLAFNDNVLVAQSDLTVRGVNQAIYTPISFDLLANRATWTFATPFGAERLQLELSNDVRDVAGNVLLNPPVQTVKILPGDVTGNGVTDLADLTAARTSSLFRTAAQATFDPYHDLDANGRVGIIDLVLSRNLGGATLPPAPSPAAAPAAATTVADAVSLSATNGTSRMVQRTTSSAGRTTATRVALRPSLVDSANQTEADSPRAAVSPLRANRVARAARLQPNPAAADNLFANL